MNILNKTVIIFISIILPISSSFSADSLSTEGPWLFSPIPSGNTILELVSEQYQQRGSMFTAESLPVDLKKLFLQSDLAELDQLSAVLRTNLLYNFSEINELILFFDSEPSVLTDYYQDRIVELAELARLYPLLISDFYDFIDKYDDDIGWYSRFGVNGVFEKVRLYKKELIILQAAWIYYCNKLDSPHASVFSAINHNQLISELERLAVKDGSFEYVLWYSRLSETFDDTFDIKIIEDRINKLLNGSISYDQSFELSLSKLTMQYRAGVVSSGQALEEVNRLIANFNSMPESLTSDSLNIYLRAILFESVLCVNHASIGVGEALVDTADTTGGNCYIGLLAKAGRYRNIAARVESLVAVRVNALLKAKPSETWQDYLAKWDNSVLLAVGKSMQFAQEPDCKAAKIIYDIIAATELYNQQEYAQMLFFRSQCQIWQDQVSVSDQLAAVADIALLLGRCNNIPGDIPSRSEQFKLLLALADAYIKFDNADLTELLRILKPLAGNQQEAINRTTVAYVPDEFSFFYASILERQGQFREAARCFANIREQSLTRLATFHRAYCLFRDGDIAADKREYYEQVVRPLRELITPDDSLDNIDIQATELLAVICIDSQWDELFYDRIMPVLEKLEPEKAEFLVNRTLGFLAGQIDSLRRIAASGSDRDFNLIHDRIFKLAVIVLEKSLPSTKTRVSELFSEIASYRLSYNAGSASLDSELKLIGPLLDKVTVFLTTDSLASVRISAFVDIMNKKYNSARNRWHKIRSVTSEQSGYLFWEARFWGIFCLILDNQRSEAIHAIDVLQAEIDNEAENENIWRSLWLDRIKELKYNKQMDN